MLRVENLYKAFGSTIAVNDLSFEVVRGEVFGLLGPNGAGKTTTINVAVGLLRPDRGSAHLDGLGASTDPRVRKSIGVATQTLSLYEEFSGQENLRFFGRLYGLSGRALSERVAWALDFVGLTQRRRDRVSAYSGGMKRRLNLASAILHDPPLLMLDEPTVGVDPQSRNAIFDNIMALRDRGTTILYTTHYMEEARRLCNRVAIMDHGELLALDTVDGLIAAHGGKSILRAETEAGEQCVETDDPISELNRIQSQNRVRTFRLDRPDLEAVFLNLTGRSLRD